MASANEGKRPRRTRGPRRLVERAQFGRGVIASLSPVDASGARFLVTVGDVDGVVSAELIGEFRLVVGRALDEGDAAALSEAVHQLRVFDQAVALLSVRARSGRNLVLALRQRGASDGEAKVAVARLGDLGLIDDATFARHVARSRAVEGGISKRRLQQELAKRGVAPEVIRDAVDDVVAEVGLDEHAGAMAVARKRLRSLTGLDARAAHRRLYAFLARRGYAAPVISRVLAQVLGGEVEPQDGDEA